jgi:predicted DNA-binding WGR domain protein
MSDTAPDFREEEPVWVRYAEWISAKHDKFYEIRIDMDETGTFWITKRWGRRPDSGGGQVKTETRQNAGQAQSMAESYFASKVGKGYTEVERPKGASQRVVKETGPDFYAEGVEAF